MRINTSVLIDSLGWALMHSIWQIVLVAALVFVALRVIPRHNAQLRFITAYGGLAATLLLFIVTWTICYRTMGAVEPVAMANAAPIEGWAALIDTLGRATGLISLVWALGFSWLGVRYTQALRATARLKLEGTGPVPTDWEMRFRLWVDRLGADPRAMILQSSRITTPLTIGTLKPIVLVPTGFFLRLPIDQAEAILVHEIAHICRQDYLLGLVQAMICNIFFYHPAIAYLSRQIDIEREYACDARVVEETGNSTALAQGLGKVALESRDLLPGFAMAADGRRTPLMDRISRLRDRPFRRESGTTTPAAALALVLAGCLTIAASADASFSSNSAKADDQKDLDAHSEAMLEAASELEIAFAEAPANPERTLLSSHVDQPARHSEPKDQHDSASEERWEPADTQGWAFDSEPGWTFSFRETSSDSQWSANSSFQSAALQQESGFLRNAALQTGFFEPVAQNDDECEDKNELIADRRLREEERNESRLEAQQDREESQLEAEMDREHGRMERQIAQEESRIVREMELIGHRLEQAVEGQGPDLDREMARLSAQMTALSSEMEARMEQQVERVRELAERARSRAESSSRRYRHSAPRVAPEPPEPAQPVITISFSIETPWNVDHAPAPVHAAAASFATTS